ncbi:hypothetical protein MYVALT_F_00830 [Candidatus Vallotia tarda]|uniref:Uncharacterized protein n=1 Tax=Candidatus Vallotiella hemipterorum TaxID=1177213 RepID=A0A916NL20_9BURK|nr:hypothetical protein MYVALT_F_00830 [Candidatus Vallotia tarda]
MRIAYWVAYQLFSMPSCVGTVKKDKAFSGLMALAKPILALIRYGQTGLLRRAECR